MKQLWFGQVQHILSVHRPGHEQPCTLIMAAWHSTVPAQEEGPYDVELQCPLLGPRVNEFFFDAAASVLPLSMAVVPHPSKEGRLVAVRRDWHVMAACHADVPCPALKYVP